MEILLDTAHLGYSKKNKIPMQNPNEVRMFFIALGRMRSGTQHNLFMNSWRGFTYYRLMGLILGSIDKITPSLSFGYNISMGISLSGLGCSIAG